MAASIVPADTKKLRACMLCSLVKSYAQFKADGCDNCDELLAMRGNTERIVDCTTTNFSGTIALMEPSESWVARWQRIDRFHQGIYAIKLTGRLPEDIVMELEERGVTYRPRDGTVG